MLKFSCTETVVVIIGLLIAFCTCQAIGLCIFGDKPDCIYPCHCKEELTEACDALTGSCRGGCEKGKPLSYGDYQSDGCLLGNIAYQKPTFSNTAISKDSSNYNRPHLWFNTNNTVDGQTKVRVFDGSCTVVYTRNKTTLPWLMVDLQNTYRIPKLTLINTDNSVDSSYLENFYVRIGNTSNITEQSICKKYSGRIRASARQTITCTNPLLGRYVSIKKYSERNKVGRLPLCELIVFGHQPIEVEWEKCYERSAYDMFCKKCIGTIPPDCMEECPENSYGQYCEGRCGHCNGTEMCDKVTGKCEHCELGWRPPRCDVQCPNGTYGLNCVHHCGRCADEQQCNLLTGHCPNGCQLWYTNNDPRCHTYIELQNVSSDALRVLFVKQTWAMLTVAGVIIEPNITKHYFFQLYYLHEDDPLKKPQPYANYTVHYNTDDTSNLIKLEIHGLLPNSQYWFLLDIVRLDKDEKEAGKRSSSVRVLTSGPDGRVPTFSGIQSNGKSGGQPSNNNIHKHVSTATIILNLIVILVLIGVAIAVGLYVYKKKNKKRREFERGASDGDSGANSSSLRDIKQRREHDNNCYDSKIGIIEQIEDDPYIYEN